MSTGEMHLFDKQLHFLVKPMSDQSEAQIRAKSGKLLTQKKMVRELVKGSLKASEVRM